MESGRWPARGSGHCGPGSVPARLLLGISLVALAGCAANAVERSIAARGGPLPVALRQVEATVYQGFPGTWTWEIAQRRPDFVRWTIHTYGEEQSYVFDGRRVLLFLGSASMPVTGDAARNFRTQARWLAVTGLDVLRDGNQVAWEEVPPAEVPAGAARGLRVRYLDDGSTYLLWFDARDLLVAAEGEVAVPPIGAGRLHADFSDFAATGGFTLPRAGRYTLGGAPLMEERILAWTPNDPRVTEASFR